MRRPIVIGNWKMNMLISDANRWVIEALNKPEYADTDIIIAPPFISLSVINEGFKGSKI